MLFIWFDFDDHVRLFRVGGNTQLVPSS